MAPGRRDADRGASGPGSGGAGRCPAARPGRGAARSLSRRGPGRVHGRASAPRFRAEPVAVPELRQAEPRRVGGRDGGGSGTLGGRPGDGRRRDLRSRRLGRQQQPLRGSHGFWGGWPSVRGGGRPDGDAERAGRSSGTGPEQPHGRHRAPSRRRNRARRQPVRRARRCAPRGVELRTPQHAGARGRPAYRRPLVERARPAGRRRTQPHRGRCQLRLAGGLARHQLRRHGLHQRDAPYRLRVTPVRVDAFDRRLGHGDLPGRQLPLVAGERTGRRNGRTAARPCDAGGSRRRRPRDAPRRGTGPDTRRARGPGRTRLPGPGARRGADRRGAAGAGAK